MSMSPGVRRALGCTGPVVLLAVLAFAAVMTTVIVAVGIWPGEAKLTAPIFCPDDRADAFVVADTYSVRPGETSTTFTMYCVGPRGETTDVGFFGPMAVLTGFHAAIIVGLVLVLTALSRLRKRGRADRADAGPPSTPTGGRGSGGSTPGSVPGSVPPAAPGDETEFEAPGPIVS